MFSRCARLRLQTAPRLTRSIYKDPLLPRELPSKILSPNDAISLGILAAGAVATYFTLNYTSERSRAAMNSPDPEKHSPPGARLGFIETSKPAPPKSEQPETPAGDGGDPNSGAFNPITGEINWECSCLGGMAYGPCGQEFRDAFSCFVYSEDEPKGINCVEKFKGMQSCFRAHPDVYGDEIAEDEQADEEARVAAEKLESENRQSGSTDAPETAEEPQSASDTPQAEDAPEDPQVSHEVSEKEVEPTASAQEEHASST